MHECDVTKKFHHKTFQVNYNTELPTLFMKIASLPVQRFSLLISLFPENGVCAAAFLMAFMTAETNEEPFLGEGVLSLRNFRHFSGVASGLLLLLLYASL
jgi:hypothetical protein